MSSLAFLSPGAHAGAEIGKVELRGDLAAFDAERIVRLTPRRAVVLCDDAPALVARARAAGLHAYDLTGALTEIPIQDDGVEQVDSATKANRAVVIQRFSPYYNGQSSPLIAERLVVHQHVLHALLALRFAAE